MILRNRQIFLIFGCLDHFWDSLTYFLFLAPPVDHHLQSSGTPAAQFSQPSKAASLINSSLGSVVNLVPLSPGG